MYEKYLEKLKKVEEAREDEDIKKLQIWKETFKKIQRGEQNGKEN